MVGIDTDEWVILADLLFSQRGDIFDRVVSGVFGEGERDFLEGFSEGADSVLLNTTDLIGLLGDGDRAGELGSTTTTNDVAVLDHVTDDADSVMEASLGLVTDGAGATTDHDCYGL